MSTLVFTQGENIVNVSGTIVYGTSPFNEKICQNKLMTIDGTDHVYTYNSVIVKTFKLLLKSVSYEHGEALRTFIHTKLIFMENTFTIGALTNIDLGTGKNTLVTCRLLDISDKDIFDFIAPGTYTISLNYRVVT